MNRFLITVLGLQMIGDLKKAQNSDDPAAAAQDLIKNLGQYKTK